MARDSSPASQFDSKEFRKYRKAPSYNDFRAFLYLVLSDFIPLKLIVLDPTKRSMVFVGSKSMEAPRGEKNKQLADKEGKAPKPKDADYPLYDGDGPTLLIKSFGSKLWQFVIPDLSERNSTLVPNLPSRFLMRVNSELNPIFSLNVVKPLIKYEEQWCEAKKVEQKSKNKCQFSEKVDLGRHYQAEV